MSPSPLSSIPVHLVTGFLGSGKSTLIRQLIAHKPEGERWAILINEFGQVGIDQAMFEESDDVVVKGLPGGCLCCQLAFVLQASLVNLLHRHRPDRLIIEPSGLGHPAGLLDMLRGEAFHAVLEVRDIIAVLDPRRLDDPRARRHETFRDQLEMADAVALTMTDLASAQQLAAAHTLLAQRWPPRKWVAEAPHGMLPITLLLDSDRHPSGGTPASDSAAHRALREKALEKVTLETASHPPGGARVVMLEGFAAPAPGPGKPVRQAGGALGHATLGWRWHADDVFELDRLAMALDRLPAGLRVKGVLHTDAGWKLYNRAEGVVTLSASAWRRDSRLEIIAEAGHLPEAEALEAAFAACCLTG